MSLLDNEQLEQKQETKFLGVYVVVQIYPWFKFSFLLFQSHYHTLPYPKTKENKCKPRIKLNHNIYIHKKLCLKSHINLSVAK